MPVKKISSDNWHKEVLESDKPVVVAFFHDQCKYSKKVESILGEVSEVYDDVKFTKLKINTRANHHLADYHGILRIPTLKFFSEGSAVGELVGYFPKNELVEAIDRRLKKLDKYLENSTDLEQFMMIEIVQSGVEGIYYSPEYWNAAKKKAREIIQERDGISFSTLAQEIKVEEEDAEKIARECADEMESIQIEDNIVGKPEAEKAEYEGKLIPKEEKAAIEEIEEEIGKKPKLEIEERKTIRLNLMDAWVSDISPIGDMRHLQELNIGATNVSDISPLANLKELRVLNAGATDISDLTPLQNLTKLSELYLWETNVSDLSPLKNLENLEVLHLWNTNVSDITPLKNLTELREIDLRNTNISNIKPLENLHNLEKLDIRDTEVNWRSETAQKLVEERDVKVQFD